MIDVLITGSWDKSIKVWDPYVPFSLLYSNIDSRSAETPLKSTHTMPERVYNLSYASATQTLLISMSHRHVYVYSLPELSASGDNCKPQSSRESALKFLTRSVACMADGKGASISVSPDSGREHRADKQDGHLDLSKEG
jgi:cell cycle arrest protein BUB3